LRRITPDVYDKKEKELRAKQHDTSIQLEDLVKADTSYHITAKTVLSLAQRAEQIFERSEVPEKRRLLNFILQNPIVKGKNVAFTLRSPFDTIVKVSSRPSLLRVLDRFRTQDWKRIEAELEMSEILGLFEREVVQHSGV